MKIKDYVAYYREIFDDYEYGYRHWCDIVWKIKLIKNRDFDKLNEQEKILRLIIEIGD